MKIMIASDIHGSSYFCGKMLTAFERESADKLLLLGDLLYHGPRNDLPEGYDPKGVIALLNGVRDKILCVRGNCDADVDQMVLSFPILADYCVLYAGGRTIYATHGHRFTPEELSVSDGDIYLYGHTHIPEKSKSGGVLRLNPGSVSIPKAGSERGYMTLTDDGFEWKTLDGSTFDKFDL